MPDLLDKIFDRPTKQTPSDLLDDVFNAEPNPELDEKQYQETADLGIRDGIPAMDGLDMVFQEPRIDKSKEAVIAGFYTSAQYKKEVERRRQEKREMGIEGYFEELLDATSRGMARIGSSFVDLQALLTDIGPRQFTTMPVLRTKDDIERDTRVAKELRKQAQFLWEVAKNPDIAAQNEGRANKALNMIGETIPYITATTAAFILTGPMGGFLVGATVEGNSAYREALDSGVDEDTARMIGAGVGVVSGTIETLGGEFASQVLERATNKLRSSALRGVAVFTTGTIVEALEEGSQEVAAIVGESVYKDVDMDEAVRRTIGAMAGGAFLGGIFKGLNVATNKLIESPTIDEAVQATAQANQPRAEEQAIEPQIEEEAAPTAPEPEITPSEPTVAPEKPPVGIGQGVRKVQPRAEEQVETAKTPEIEQQVGQVVETDFTSKETQKGLEELTSARQAAIAEDRKAIGLDEINSKGRREWEKALKQAKSENIAAKAQRLADEVNAEPRPLNDIETAGVVIRMTELKNEHDSAMKSLKRMTDDANIKTQSAEVQRIEAEFEALTRAVDLSGTEKGRALAAQKLTINRDYDLVSVVTRAKAAKGAEVSAKERSRFEDLTTKLEDANKRIEALTMEVAEIKAIRNLRTTRTARGFAQMSTAQRNANLQSLASDVNALLKQGCNN